MANKDYNYNRIKNILRKTQILLEDVGDTSDLEIQGKKRGSDADYDDKKSAVLNLLKKAQNEDEKNNLFIKTGYQLLDSAKKAGDDVKFQVKEIFVDLTKLSNEMKEFSSLTDEKKKIDKIRKISRYVSTAVINSNKIIKEIEQKKADLDAKINMTAYQKELDALKEKYGLTVSNELDGEIEVLKDNAQKIEDENKNIIRAFRSMLGELYEVPKEVAEISKIHLQTYGAIITMSKRQKPPRLKKGAIKDIMNDPELFKMVEEFIEFPPPEEMLTIVDAKIPKLASYFAELNLKVDQEINKINVIEDEVEKINESIMPRIMEKTKKVFMKAVNTFFSVLFSETKELKKKVKNDLKPIVDAFESTDRALKDHRKNAEKGYLRVQKKLKELDIEMISHAEKELA